MPDRFKVDKNPQNMLITTSTVTSESFEHNDIK